MKLTGLELFGFKSFLNRTKFHFNHGVSAIVGPNGCGKSNIVDAIVWVAGERGTKSLRVKDMGDVIFHGSNGKRPVNIAEVAIELSDGDKDFTVKRRIYRDGLNEYFLNGKIVRLKDIQDFFLGSGIGLNAYAIVEQGKIETFIHMKPYERRIVIEEASGITRFEEKKREAIIRMEEVKTNLERVEDIHGEVRSSLEKAEAEWERWKIYKSLTDKQSMIDSLILMEGHGKLLKKINRTKEKKENLNTEFLLKEEEKEKLKEELTAKENEFSLTGNVINQLEVDIKGKEKDMEKKVLEIDYIVEESKRLEKEKEEVIRNKAILEEEIARNREKIEILKNEQIELIVVLDENEKKTGYFKKVMDELKKSMESLEKKMEEQRVELFVVMSSISNINNRLLEIERARMEMERRRQKKAEERLRFEERLITLESKEMVQRAALENQKSNLELLMSQKNRTFTEREKLNNKIVTNRRDMETLRAEKRGKEEFLRQMSNFRNDTTGKLPGVKKLIDIIRTDEIREKALERFFFREMEYYVLTDRNINELTATVKKYSENFIFFSEKGLFQSNGNEVDIKINWISGIEEGIARISKGEEGVFINEEIFLDSRGLILQERAEKQIDLKKFREVKRVKEELKNIQMDIDLIIALLKKMDEEYIDIDKILKQVKKDVGIREEGIKKIERELAVTEAEMRTVRERLFELDSEIDFSDETKTEGIEELLEEKEKQERIKKGIEEIINIHKEEHEDLKKKYESVSADWHDITIEGERKKSFVKSLCEDIERKKELVSHSLEESHKMEEKEGNLKKELVLSFKKQEELEKDYEKIKSVCDMDIARYEELKVIYGNIHMEKSRLQKNIEIVSGEMERLRNRKEGIETEIAVMTEKLDAIIERLSSVYGIMIAEEINIQPGRNLEDEREEIVKALSDLGEVNFRAEKEYCELKERSGFLENQKEDLKNALDSLKKTIMKIDSLSREMFFETFETVNNAFKKFTFMLFKGGNGYLSFNHDIAGVDMFAQPPGKKTARMELLSGGEKTLISLSLLLALMDTKPSPLSLMDEIDAPLDDANIASLMEIIRIISRKTQIVLITHNRITMEHSNTIYGITMEEEGISKIVSVKL